MPPLSMQVTVVRSDPRCWVVLRLKITQLDEGSNQVQRVVIARQLLKR